MVLLDRLMAETGSLFAAEEAISAGAGAASERGSAMNLNDLKSQVALGDDSRRQFKRGVVSADSLAAMVLSPARKPNARF